MPENECLIHDERIASRWRSIGNRLDEGQTPLEVLPEIQQRLHGLFQKVWKQWKWQGIDPSELFAAALNDPIMMRQFIKRARF